MDYTNENDFKYVLREVSRTTIGARFRYEELLDDENVPFKLRLIIDRLILPYADAAQTIGEHLLALHTEDPNFRIYRQLKAKIKYFVQKPGGGYTEKTSGIEELVKFAPAQAEETLFVQEVIISNLALMGIHL